MPTPRRPCSSRSPGTRSAGIAPSKKGHPRYDEAHRRVYISEDNAKTGKQGQYFEGVPPEVWDFQVGGYQPCQKWLKDRVGRQLTYDDLTHYQRIDCCAQRNHPADGGNRRGDPGVAFVLVVAWRDPCHTLSP